MNEWATECATHIFQSKNRNSRTLKKKEHFVTREKQEENNGKTKKTWFSMKQRGEKEGETIGKRGKQEEKEEIRMEKNDGKKEEKRKKKGKGKNTRKGEKKGPQRVPPAETALKLDFFDEKCEAIEAKKKIFNT